MGGTPDCAASPPPGELGAMSPTQSLIHTAPQLPRAGSRRPVVHRRTISLYARVVSVNAAVLLVAVLVLALTPAGVSSQTTAEEGAILALVLVVMVVANALLLRFTFSGL